MAETCQSEIDLFAISIVILVGAEIVANNAILHTTLLSVAIILLFMLFLL